MKLTITFCVIIHISTLSGSFQSIQAIEQGEINGNYFGLTQNGKEATVFAPDIISTSHHEHSSPAFSPDGKEVFWSMWRRPDKGEPQVIMHMKQINGKWTHPQIAPFSGIHKDGGPCFSGDGQKIYFQSRRPLNKKEGKESPANHIWYVTRTKRGWSLAKPVPYTDGKTYPGACPTISNNNILIMNCPMQGSRYRTGLFISKRTEKGFTPPKPLGKAINTPHLNWTPKIAPTGEYIIFSSNRPGQKGNGDLYVSFKQSSGMYGVPKHLGPAVNTAAQERFPGISPDGKYLFFTRSTEEKHDDVYWIDMKYVHPLAKPITN